MSGGQYTVHPSSIVEDGAQIGEGCEIGPFCVIGPNVVLGAGSRLKSHVVLAGNTRIGEGARIHPFASIGNEPQHLKYMGEDTRLVIGRNCLIREHVTMNPGTIQGRSETTVGDNCAFFTGSHVAHDCLIENNVTLINNGGLAAVEGDVIPFGMVLGNRAYLSGLNVIGMKRAGFNRDAIRNVRKAYRMLFSDDLTFRENLDEVESEYPDDPLVQDLLGFIRAGGDRAICFPRSTRPS